MIEMQFMSEKKAADNNNNNKKNANRIMDSV